MVLRPISLKKMTISADPIFDISYTGRRCHDRLRNGLAGSPV